jgi:hypothetical protein
MITVVFNFLLLFFVGVKMKINKVLFILFRFVLPRSVGEALVVFRNFVLNAMPNVA